MKGHDILLAAFSKFISHYPQWHLVIVGDGEWYDKLKQLGRMAQQQIEAEKQLTYELLGAVLDNHE